MNFNPPNKSLVAAIAGVCCLGAVVLLALFYYSKQESDSVPNNDATSTATNFVEPYDPFDYTKAYRNAEYNQVRIDYLVTPNKDTELVLKKIEEITGKEGVFLGKDVTILSDGSAQHGISGDLYQIQIENVFSLGDALAHALGGGTDTGWVYIRSDAEASPGESYENRARLYDAQGNPFFAIQKRNGNVSDIVYSEKELPDFVLKLLETYNAGSSLDIYAHLQNKVLIVGERGIADVGTLHIYTIDGETIQNIFSHTYDSLGDFVFLESPDQTKIAVSFWREGTGSSSFVNQSVIFNTETQTVVMVPIAQDNLFPTFWINGNELTYGTAAGKDCGYYPHAGHFNISQNQFAFTDTSIDYHFERYLDSYINRDSVGYRLFDVADGSKYLNDDMCGRDLDNKIIGLSESGVSEELYGVSDGEYLVALGYIDENNLLFFTYPVLETAPDGRFVQKHGIPSAHLLNKETKQVTPLTHAELQELFEKAQQEDFIVNENSSVVLDTKNLDLDYITYTLFSGGSVLDVFEQPTGAELSNRSEYGYFMIGKRENRYETLETALDLLKE